MSIFISKTGHISKEETDTLNSMRQQSSSRTVYPFALTAGQYDPGWRQYLSWDSMPTAFYHVRDP